MSASIEAHPVWLLGIWVALLRGEESTLNRDAIESWFSANYAMLSKKERVYLAPSSQQAALGHVLRYYERENGNWDRILKRVAINHDKLC